MQVIAHRGASGYAPENTRAAFEKAIAMGSDAVETDVQLTTDGELVLFHDTTVDRTSDGHGPVTDYALAELRALDLGGWFGAEYAGERVLTVTEMADAFLPRIPVVFEIKDPRAAVPLVTFLAGRGVLDRVQTTSFFWGALLDAQAAVPDADYGFLTPVFTDDLIARCVRRGFRQLCPRVDTLTAGQVAKAHAAGLRVRGWGVAHRHEIALLHETGADGATVNWPDWMDEAVAESLSR